MTNPTRPKLNDGSHVAVIGGGPAGSFFSYFMLDMAERVNLKLHVDLYEPRDFDIPGPPGCNMCAGVLHESLVQSLAAEGINLPTAVVQRGMDSNILHVKEVGSARIETPRHEKRIATTFRGIGPRGLQDLKWGSLDGYLLSLAVKKGTHHIRSRVNGVERVANPLTADQSDKLWQVKTQGGTPQTYDLLVVAAGVNTSILKHFQDLDIAYQPPRTMKALVREYRLGEEAVARYVGPSMHAFLLNIPRIEYAAIIPKADYATVCLIGKEIDSDVMQAFLNDPAVKQCFPPDLPLDRFACQCGPRINIKGSPRPYGDRIVFVGDCGVSRLRKDGNGAAYRAAKAAARTVIFEGISAEDFRRHYMPLCRSMENDNLFGKIILLIVSQLQKVRFGRRAILRMIADEQQGSANVERGMSMVLWDMFTGSAHYREIFLRTLHPVFWTRFLWALIVSLLPSRAQLQMEESAATGRSESDALTGRRPWKEDTMEPGALGKVYEDGEIVVRQGEAGDCMYVIQEGQVEILAEQDGREVQLAVREAGDIFGEMAVFERDVRSATVRALGKVRVLTVDDKTFLRRVHEDPSLAYRLVKTLSHRIRELSVQVAQLERRMNND